MIEKIDDLIEDNLNRLYNAPNKSMFYPSMIDQDGHSFKRISGERFTDILIGNGLITRDNERCDLTVKGLEICQNGGWKKFCQDLKTKEQESQQSHKYRNQLELQNLELQNESAEYAISIREKDEKIRMLTEENLTLQNKQLRRYIIYSIIALFTGAILTNIKEIWRALNL